MRQTFFKGVFGRTEGYLCIAVLDPHAVGMKERFFLWPQEETDLYDYIDGLPTAVNVYYCPQLFEQPKRRKELVHVTVGAWADLDSCHPSHLETQPTVITESSTGRYQAVWCFESPQAPEVGEDISRRIAYKYKDKGCDTSGWDLTQLLRVPYTANMKYQPPHTVRIVAGGTGNYRPADFAHYPKVEGFEHLDIPFPEELPKDKAEELLRRFKYHLAQQTFKLFEETPEERTWSSRLWSLMMLCFEGGMSREQVFLVAEEAACNKFARKFGASDRSRTYLWQDVCRAYFKHEANEKIVAAKPEPEGPLLTDDERTLAEAQDSWVERYIRWAGGLGDAAKQYHQAGAFIALSSVLAGSVQLPTSFGSVVPNLWFMLLADTTLTRKTTAMDIAMDMLTEINDEFLLATDGSLEGMFTALSTRPRKPSIFLRDEFSGLLEQMTKRDYMAGFPEMLTKLYDGKEQKRLLRKETVTVKDPCLIIFAGGIRTKTQEILTHEQVSSGFLPRFIFITAESDVSKIQPLGPPTERNWGRRDEIKGELADLAGYFDKYEQVIINDKVIGSPKKRLWNAELTPEAWTRYNKLEASMMSAGVNSEFPEIYTPLYDRLGKSILKASVLLAASRQKGAETVRVEATDIIHAIYYGEGWRGYAKEVIAKVGVSKDEKKMQTILTAIYRHNGMSRSSIMQSYHLTGRDMTAIVDTLEQRNLITRTKVGRAEMFHPTHKAGTDD
jgi:hypothetical protein